MELLTGYVPIHLRSSQSEILAGRSVEHMVLELNRIIAFEDAQRSAFSLFQVGEGRDER